MKVGRPTKQTPEVVTLIASAIADGFNDEEAALVAGVNPHTISLWRKQEEFCAAVKTAELKRLQKRLQRIEAGEMGWQGTAWILERVHKERFSRPEVQFAQQINVTTQGAEISLAPGQLQALSEAYNAEKEASVKEITNVPTDLH
jgi:hypothetical protein